MCTEFIQSYLKAGAGELEQAAVEGHKVSGQPSRSSCSCGTAPWSGLLINILKNELVVARITVCAKILTNVHRIHPILPESEAGAGGLEQAVVEGHQVSGQV